MLIVFIYFVVFSAGGAALVNSWGHFVARVKAEWHDDGRTMTLLDDCGYVNRAGYNWKAPKEHAIDGASIPRVFWTFIGGPFEGKYQTLRCFMITNAM